MATFGRGPGGKGKGKGKGKFGKNGRDPKKVSALFKRRKFLIGGLVMVAALVLLMVTAFQGASMYYLTVSELKGMGPNIFGEPVRIRAWATGDPVVSEPGKMILKFTASDQEGAGEKLAVVYRGVVPDGFKEGAEVVLEGQYTAAGVFEANKLLTKCPSKYETEDEGG